MINYADYPANWTPLANDASDAAWQGSPMSRFAKGGRAGARPFEIKIPREHMEKMAKGGLAGQAKNVADAGVGGDTMVIHINKDEYKQLCKEWGEPTINPHTGMPQFTPFWKQSWFAPVAALAGTALMATGVGAGLGTALLGDALGGTTLASATGISGLGSATLGGLAGNAALSAGIGALTGGTKGALTSGLLGAAGTVGASALGNYLGSANTSSNIKPIGDTTYTVGDPSSVGTSGPEIPTGYTPYVTGDPTSVGMYGPQMPTSAAGGTPASVGAYGPEIPAGAKVTGLPSATGSSGVMSNLTGYLTDPNKMAAAAVGLGSLTGALGGSSEPSSAVAATPTSTATDPNLTKRLPSTPMERIRLAGPLDYYNYGSAGEHLYYAPQQTQAVTPTVQAARGGALSHYVQGGGTGRSDSIPARLSDGEYVMDAETVALLGDGSSKAGAKKLDQFRANIRKQKGKALSKGKISPDAESPDHYLMGGRA
jgi:hypothetical protein